MLAAGSALAGSLVMMFFSRGTPVVVVARSGPQGALATLSGAAVSSTASGLCRAGGITRPTALDGLPAQGCVISRQFGEKLLRLRRGKPLFEQWQIDLLFFREVDLDQRVQAVEDAP